MQFIKKIVCANTTLVLIDQAIYSGTNFFLTLFLAKQLNIEDFGLFSTIVVFTFLALSLMNALIIQPFQVSIATVSKRKEYFVFLFLGLVILLFFFMFLTWIPALFFKINICLFLNVNFFISAFLFQDFFRKLFLGINKIKWVLIIDLFFLLFVSIGFYLWIFKFDFEITLFLIGLSNFISGAIGLVFIFQMFEWPSHWKIFLKTHIQQAKWLLSVAVLQWASSNFFVLVSGIYLGIEALGALRLVQSFFGILNVVLQTVENYYLPKIASLYHQNKELAKTYLVKISTYGALFFGTILSLFFFFASHIIVLAGGNQYEKYAYVVKIMAVLYVFIFMSYPVRIMIRVLLLNKIFFIGYLISFIFSLASFHLLLNYFELSGAILGLIINQIILLLYWQNQLKNNHFLLWK